MEAIFALAYPFCGMATALYIRISEREAMSLRIWIGLILVWPFLVLGRLWLWLDSTEL